MGDFCSMAAQRLALERRRTLGAQQTLATRLDAERMTHVAAIELGLVTRRLLLHEHLVFVRHAIERARRLRNERANTMRA